MYNPELLKESFRRHNVTEQKVLCSVIDKNPDVRIFRGKDIVSVDWIIKMYKGQTMLIVDAKNPNHTEIGNNHVTEFCLITKKGEKIWIDAKHLFKYSKIADTVSGDFMRAENCLGEFLYVCDGAGYTERTINQLNEYANLISNKTKIKVIDFCNLNNYLSV